MIHWRVTSSTIPTLPVKPEGYRSTYRSDRKLAVNATASRIARLPLGLEYLDHTVGWPGITRYRLHVGDLDAVIEVADRRRCVPCFGRGYMIGGKLPTCRACGGTGDRENA